MLDVMTNYYAPYIMGITVIVSIYLSLILFYYKITNDINKNNINSKQTEIKGRSFDIDTQSNQEVQYLAALQHQKETIAKLKEELKDTELLHIQEVDKLQKDLHQKTQDKINVQKLYTEELTTFQNQKYELKCLKQQIADYQKKSAETDLTIKNLQNSINEVQHNYNQVKTELDLKVRDYNELQNKNYQQDRDIIVKASETDKNNQTIKSLTTQLKEIEGYYNLLKEEHSQLKSDFNKLQYEKTEQNNKYQVLEKKFTNNLKLFTQLKTIVEQIKCESDNQSIHFEQMKNKIVSDSNIIKTEKKDLLGVLNNVMTQISQIK